MEVKLTVAGDDATAMRSLEEWLTGHGELGGRVRPAVMAPQPGTMGSVAEVLMVTVGTGWGGDRGGQCADFLDTAPGWEGVGERNPARRRGDHSHS